MDKQICLSCMREYDGDGPCPHCGFELADYKAPAHHLRPGTVLAGKYMVGRAIGAGGFGITYAAWDQNLETKVAVKEFFPDGFVARDGSMTKTVTVLPRRESDFYQKGQERFVDEARRLAKFADLPGIVSVKDYFQENNTAYIVMEYAEGQTLKAVLRQQPHGRMDTEIVLAMMEPVMDSLEQVHQAGLIHRDISPDNLMVDDRGRVKLLDFGSARAFVADGQKSLSVMLKPGYTPEEQYRSRGSQGPWTDVYALCATIYRAITGRMPPESLERRGEGNDNLKRPSKMGVSIRPAQEEALLKGLAVYKEDRIQSIGELRAMLNIEELRPTDDDDPVITDYRRTDSGKTKFGKTEFGKTDVEKTGQENFEQTKYDGTIEAPSEQDIAGKSGRKRERGIPWGKIAFVALIVGILCLLVLTRG
ncbi:MAG: serine/threonine protein kinase [Lachnospiraceae bacterium]|nr:serine/threonine protein kinase [Lachnospiraceae bacterium]